MRAHHSRVRCPPGRLGRPSGDDGSAAYARHMHCPASGWRPRPTTTYGATASASTRTTPDGLASPCRVTGRITRRSAPATVRSCTAMRSAPRRRPRGRRRWITLDGIFYQADVWLDGAYLGDPEGYFFSHSFDVTSLSRFGDDHVLAVEVTCAPHTAPPDAATSPASSRHRRGSARTATPADSGAGHPVRHRPGAHRADCGCCAATPMRDGRTCASRPASTATGSRR
jgi:hypothetical protein